jgi:hypothetical protein
MNRHTRTNERLLAQYLLLAALAVMGMPKEFSSGTTSASSRRSRTSKSRCPCCGSMLVATKR